MDELNNAVAESASRARAFVINELTVTHTTTNERGSSAEQHEG